MKHFAIIILLTLIACEQPGDNIMPRNGSTDGTTVAPEEACPAEPPPLATPEETAACACDPKAPKCPTGTECVSVTDGVNRCLAPAFGEAPDGGAYITACAYLGEPRALIVPDGLPGTTYCSACLYCRPPLEDSLICSE